MIERRDDDLVMPGEEMQRIAKAELESNPHEYGLYLAANVHPMKRSTWQRLAKQMGLAI